MDETTPDDIQERARAAKTMVEVAAENLHLRAVNAKLLSALEPFVALLLPHVEANAFQGDDTGVFGINQVKIVICQSCGDAVALSIKERRCDCGKSGGIYLADFHTAEVDGPSHVIGVPNSLAHRIEREATAWVFREPYERIVRRNK